MKRYIIIAIFMLSSYPATALCSDRIVIGISPSLTATLNIIAKQQGFFSKQGVDAELRVIESGSKAFVMMLNDELDISESAIFSLVTNSFIRKDFKIYTVVAIAGNDNMIIARKDKGIRKIEDLIGKKVGVLKGGLPQYVLDLMLLNAGLDPKKIKLIFEESAQLYQFLSSGELDAVCLYGGWIDKATRILKDNAILFHDENLVRVTVVHAGKSRKFDSDPDLYSRVLKAYIKTEEYIKKNPEAALKTVVDYLNLDMGNARKVWKPNLAHVSLDNSLIKDMENIARWQIDSGMQKSTKIPDYLDFIHFKTLQGIDPKRVSIVH